MTRHAPLLPPRPQLNLLPILQWHDLVQEFEQCIELLELSVFLLAKPSYLVGVFLVDRRVEFGEGIARRDVSDWLALEETHQRGWT